MNEKMPTNILTTETTNDDNKKRAETEKWLKERRRRREGLTAEEVEKKGEEIKKMLDKKSDFEMGDSVDKRIERARTIKQDGPIISTITEKGELSSEEKRAKLEKLKGYLDELIKKEALFINSEKNKIAFEVEIKIEKVKVEIERLEEELGE